MCGFVTLLNKTGNRVNEDHLRAMTDVIYHRGPDSEGLHIENNIGLGFRRLSIIDLENGSQPMADETENFWLTFNGEIYNYQELQNWLKSKGHKFKTNSDTETIIHLYKEVGFDAPSYLRGMFSFVIWDKVKNLVFGARDHFGIKPLYWTETSNHIVFASEIKSILELPEINRTPSMNSFYNYLTFQYVPEPFTMFDNIYKVAPGHTFIIKNNKIEFNPYFEAMFSPDENLNFDSAVKDVRQTLEDSVRKHTICDVNWGAFLSSGVDSSSIVGLLSKHSRIKTFTVGFDIPGYEELSYARRTAKHFNTEHYEHEITADEYLAELPGIIWHQDEPVADPSAIALYFVAKLAKNHVKVALSGEGADEFFGGYNIYKEPSALQLYSSALPQNIRNMVAGMVSKLPNIKGRSYLMRGAKKIEDRFLGNAQIFSEDAKKMLFQNHGEINFPSPFEVTNPFYSKVKDLDDVSKMKFIDIKTWLCGNILMKADKMTMANSLELRVPFLDKEVFSVATNIPTKFQLAGGTTKFILRKAMEDILPDEIKMRKKLGFPVPLRVWLKNEFYAWAKEIINDFPINWMINKKYVLQMLEDHKSGKVDESRKLWVVLVFIIWHQIYINKTSYPNLNINNIAK